MLKRGNGRLALLHKGQDPVAILRGLAEHHHRRRGGGHVYQGRFNNFPIRDDLHFLTVCRYVEANPLRSKRVEKGELKPMQQSVNRGRPFGDARWVAQTAARLGLGNSLHEPGRPAKPPRKRQGKRETGSDPLSSSVVREIVYRLLTGAQGSRLSHLAAFGGQAHRIVRAVGQLREKLDKPLRIEPLARELGMSASAFHAHFKAVTNMSPLQYQKHLRLQEARRLTVGEHLDAGEAGFRVGYEDQSHFGRDYKRHFGEPPMRDVERMREAATA
jgi:AraC-like DNA-binding protein